MSRKINTIILAACKFEARNVSVGMIQDAGLQPIRGKAAIAWVIDSALRNGAEGIKVLLRRDGVRLSQFLSYRYPEIDQVPLGAPGNMPDVSAVAILGLCDDDLPTQLIMGDTLINEDFPEEKDVFLASPEVRVSKDWCLVSKDSENHIREIYNKEEDVPLEGKEALVGYYKLSDTQLLKRIAMEQYSRGHHDLIRMLTLYNEVNPILIKTTEHWYNFGDASGVVRARRELFAAREFNKLAVDAVRGTITKTSTRKQKLLDEVNWYRSIPKELAVYVPRVFRVEEREEAVSIEMEMYGYANLAETFLYGASNFEDWYQITRALMEIHGRLVQYTKVADREELKGIYMTKTNRRLAEMLERAPGVHALMQRSSVSINGGNYRNIPQLRENLNSAIDDLLNYELCTIVHGDYCFSNILFDSMHFIFKLIDPRGRFSSQSIYGDPRYDMAKLRHSVVGLYDFVVAGLYRLKEEGTGKYELQISSPPIAGRLQVSFDEMVQAAGYKLSDIKLIEALIFLTMIPLHEDDEKRQLAFFLIAIQKLNDVLYGN